MPFLRDILYPAINLSAFQQLRKSQPKRICFATTHANALKASRQGPAAGFLNLPLAESIGYFLPWRIFENTRGQFGGYYRTIPNQEEYAQTSRWIERQGTTVFIRSLFKGAIALSEHYGDNERRTEVGELEHSAKYEGNAAAAEQLADMLEEAYKRLFQQGAIDAVVAVPSSKPGGVSLPGKLAAKLATRTGVPDLSGALRWNGSKPSIKEVDVDGKWDALDRIGLSVDPVLAGKNVLLIDDMYQSGATAHFVAGQLRSAGVNDLFLMAVSKGRRDTDNQ